MVQFVFGYGVGGEYPMAAGSAAERAEAGGRKTASKRGREVRSGFLRFTQLIGPASDIYFQIFCWGGFPFSHYHEHELENAHYLPVPKCKKIPRCFRMHKALLHCARVRKEYLKVNSLV